VLEHAEVPLQSETNRLREVPAARAARRDLRPKRQAHRRQRGRLFGVRARAEEDTLRAVLQRLSGTINITPQQIEQAVRRFRRAPARPR
jgi:hypothetical protein